jgi:hypothetical protein
LNTSDPLQFEHLISDEIQKQKLKLVKSKYLNSKIENVTYIIYIYIYALTNVFTDIFTPDIVEILLKLALNSNPPSINSSHTYLQRTTSATDFSFQVIIRNMNIIYTY